MIENKDCTGILIFNNQNELALQLRAPHDDSFPSHWDFSAGGGIEMGEDIKISAEREVLEELGVKVKVEFLTQEYFTYTKWNSGIVRQSNISLYTARYNGPFDPDPKEVTVVEFFSLEKIEEMIKSGEKFHPEFILCWNKEIIQHALS